MFHRKRRSASMTRQYVALTPSAPAQRAATQAFLAGRHSHDNLSASSAAAAALRSMSPTPTSVSGIQTKRMLQRQNSAGSLQRQSSTGSMTERTFRAPSPNRHSQSSPLETPPPVPPVPKTYSNDSQRRRAASMEPSMRVVSPLPTKKAGRVASLDRAPVSAQRVPQDQHQPRDENELDRSASRGSINFSYPTAARPNSPLAQRPLSPTITPVMNGVYRQAANDTQNTMSRAPDQQIRKRKKRVASGSREGGHSVSDAMVGGPSGSPGAAYAGGAELEQTSSDSVQKKKDMGGKGPQTNVRRESPVYGSDSDSTPDTFKSKKSQRAYGLLQKQPSVVREDWEGEQEDQRAAAAPSLASRPSDTEKEIAVVNSSKSGKGSDHSIQEGRPTPHLITTFPSTNVAQRAKAPSQDYLEVVEDSVRPARQTSTSPSRSTRFSAHLASDLSSRPRHEPPPRSVSPAKSALKHHSPSSQSASPTDAATATSWKRNSRASSEASDNASMASADGLGTKLMRKKSARVSFEAEPEAVGPAADVTQSDTPFFISAQYKDSGKKGWLGKSRGGQLDAIPAEDEMEDVMKPRPVLPSFGSVRGRRDDSIEDVTLVAETASLSSSDTSSNSNLATMDTSISSDNAIGGLLARESLRIYHAPIGETSKTTHAAITLSAAEESGRDEKSRTNGTIGSSFQKEGRALAAPNIPAIAIQPATPSILDPESRDQWLVEVPGGFPASSQLEGDSPANGTQRKLSSGDVESPTSLIADVKNLEPKPAVLVSANPTHVSLVGSTIEPFRPQPETMSDSESGGSSIYSDAAEDLSDLEGDGFGSINAIVESPVVGEPANRMTTPDSPLIGKFQKERIGIRPRQDSWEQAEAHWRRVAGRRHSTDQDQQKDPDVAQTMTRKKRKKKKKTTGGVAEALTSAQSAKDSGPVPDSPNFTLPQSSAYPIVDRHKASAGQSAFRRSMRGQAEEMSNTSGLRSSMRSMEPPERPARILPPSRAALQKRKVYASSGGSMPMTRREANPSSTFSRSSVVAPRRRMSSDSNSSSSFKRSRRPASSNGNYTMRTSMRSSENRVTSPAPAGGGVRSLSPQNRRPYSPMGQGTLRTTMRGSADAGALSPRNQNRQKPSTTVSGFKKSRSKVKGGASKPLGLKAKSRVADSDEEDVSERQAFRSRYEDSSDEEPDVIKYRPVRGIPGKPDQGDSTDLEDSSDEGGRRTNRSRLQDPQSSRVVDGTTEETTKKRPGPATRRTMSPGDGKKKGIFGRFRDKARDSTRDVESATTEHEGEHEHTRAVPQGARSPETPASPDGRGKLQRKHTPQRMTSKSWPLPLTNDDGPKSSDGAGGANGINVRPDLGMRQDTSDTVRTDGGTRVLGRTGKKKRFPRLRKAFGLHD